jgi:hypothetical protein
MKSIWGYAEIIPSEQSKQAIGNFLGFEKKSLSIISNTLVEVKKAL